MHLVSSTALQHASALSTSECTCRDHSADPQIGGSLAKVVYFTRSSQPLSRTPPSSHPSSPFLPPSQSLASSSSFAASSSYTGARTVDPSFSPSSSARRLSGSSSSSSSHPLDAPPHAQRDPSPPEHRRPTLNGALTPGILASETQQFDYGDPPTSNQAISIPNGPSHPAANGTHPNIRTHPALRRSSIPPPLPGGLLNFARFETDRIGDLITFLQELISTSAAANRVSLDKMKTNVKVMATGGGAHLFYDRLRSELGVEVAREEEMECLILGLGFVARVPEEVFWFSEELVYKVSHPDADVDGADPRRGANGEESTHLAPPKTIPPSELPRPSPTPPAYQVSFASPGEVEVGQTFPCLVVNIGSGVSIVKVDEEGKFERVSGTSLGGGTLWGLLSLLTDAESFDGELCGVVVWSSRRQAEAMSACGTEISSAPHSRAAMLGSVKSVYQWI